jgi:acetyltransferase
MHLLRLRGSRSIPLQSISEYRRLALLPAARQNRNMDGDREVVELRDGVRIALRPICPEDESAMTVFHRTLSDRSVHFRYFHQIALSERITHERLSRVCFIDPAKEMALVAETCDGAIVGVGRLTSDSEFAVIVSDAWQDRGVGSALLGRLIQIARRKGLRGITGAVLADNTAMLDLCFRLGFTLAAARDGVVEASLDLQAAPVA